MLFLASVTLAHAQGTTTIRGAVHDEQLAAVPGATVTIRHSASGLERETVTDLAGTFVLANLPLGTHDFAVSMPGFRTFVRRIEATTGVSIDVDATLALAPFTDMVRVMPSEPAVDTTSAGTRHAISVTRIERMPGGGLGRS